MSDHLDDRIRDLYAELAEAAPPLPPLPAPESVPSPWVRRWPVLVGVVTAAIVVIAAVPLVLGGFFGVSEDSADTTSIAAAETTEAPAAEVTTTVSAETTEAPAAEELLFEDAIQSLTVSTETVDLAAEVLAAADGLVVGAGVEFTGSTGDLGHADVVIVVEDGAATMLRGQFCGSAWWPPPFADTEGGVIVNSTLPDTRRCTPGEQVERIPTSDLAVTTAVVDDRPVVALATHDGIDLRDLATGSTQNLATFDPTVETPIGASYGGGRWMISLLGADESFGAGGSTRYAFFDKAGAPLVLNGNLAPDFSPATTTYRVGALTPDGASIVFVEQFADLSADVVVWDLDTGSEIERYRIIEPFAGPEDGVGGGEQFARSIDASDTAIVVNVDIANGELHPGRIVRIDRTAGTVTDLESGLDGIRFQLASFRDRP